MGPPQEAAVKNLKQCLSAAPVLKIYNPEAIRTELHTDASQFGFGAVLLQVDDNDDERLHPICYTRAVMSRRPTSDVLMCNS